MTASDLWLVSLMIRSITRRTLRQRGRRGRLDNRRDSISKSSPRLGDPPALRGSPRSPRTFSLPGSRRRARVEPMSGGGELPAGTVTFMFTDIEGSTRLLRQLGDDYFTLIRR